MNYLFATQSNYLQLFIQIEKCLIQRGLVVQSGYFVSHLFHFDRFQERISKSKEDFSPHSIVNEWTIIEEALSTKCVDEEKLIRYENYFYPLNLHKVMASDRRILLGKEANFKQAYRWRFSHREIKKIFIHACLCIEEQFKYLKPDVVMGFINVTFCEYLYYLFAQKLGIQYLNLRNTKIDNLITAAPDIYEPSKNIESKFFIHLNLDAKATVRSKNVLDQISRDQRGYEGQDYLKKKESMDEVTLSGIHKMLHEVDYWRKVKNVKAEYWQDNHFTDPIKASYYKYLINPKKIKSIIKNFKSNFKHAFELQNESYVFFPMHLEPEISLLHYGFPFSNQLDLIRIISQSLPLSYKLVVKDHPKKFNYRKSSYYEKLLRNPNVIIANPQSDTYDWIKNSKAIVTVNGWVGFEAVCLKKPVIVLGESSYQFIGNQMVKKVKSLSQLGEELFKLIKEYQYDENRILLFIESILGESVEFDWYTLGKKLSEWPKKEIQDFLEEKLVKLQFGRLIDYLSKKINNLKLLENNNKVERPLANL